ncbi:MAG TPA: hypothetical protein VGP93_10890, partial [Polyangiaceae bacterium]|nr:hypothetical protein [Polyangiaceae bacterium]
FDVSASSTERTPIVRPGAPRLPLEPADRIGFSSAALQVGFALRDLPASDPATGIAATGTLCDPDPALDPAAAGAQYRPTQDFTSGARPDLLRGVFGFVMLSSGQVAVIDVEDFDAPCRRPITTNSSSAPDFRGCASDMGLPADLTVDGTPEGTPTVTGEVSCLAVQPHRARSATLALNNARVGVRAPTLRAFPQFSTPDPSEQTSVQQRPKLLAVPFNPPDPAKPDPLVFVGSDLYGPGLTHELDVDPHSADQNSVSLPLEQPRSYASEEAFVLTYEGAITGTLPSGFYDLQSGEAHLDDGSANFCDRGVYSVRLMREFGAEQFALSGDALEAFAQKHADYVQITGDLPADTDSYWSSERGLSCGGRSTCETVFGPFDARDLAHFRELRVLDAFQDQLVVEPRNAESAEELDYLKSEVDCCFPSGIAYTVRASEQWVLTGSISGFRHDVTARAVPGEPDRFSCERDCSPRKRYYKSRAFELSRQVPGDPGSGCGEDVTEEQDCPIGAATADDLVCVYDATTGPVVPGGPGSECILSSLTSRFVVYRGQTPSARGMTFNWQTAGGFFPLVLSLTSQAQSVLPQSMLYLPELQDLAVVDASTLGLTIISLDSLRVEAAFY